MATYLDDIVALHRRVAASDRRDASELERRAMALPPARGFRAALAASAAVGLAVIAEIKRRSPSKGDLALDLDPGRVASEYAGGGAAALSVLTDVTFFGGSPADLTAASAACALPVLRKDFTVCRADVYDARVMGADAVLLIVAALSDVELADLLVTAEGVGLDALVEVHDETELERALEAGSGLVGVNQRDLETFHVDEDRAARLADRIPSDVVAVAESGVRDAADAARLGAAGYQAVLVGETVVRSADRMAAVASLVGHRVGSRAKPARQPADGAAVAAEPR